MGKRQSNPGAHVQREGADVRKFERSLLAKETTREPSKSATKRECAVQGKPQEEKRRGTRGRDLQRRKEKTWEIGSHYTGLGGARMSRRSGETTRLERGLLKARQSCFGLGRKKNEPEQSIQGNSGMSRSTPRANEHSIAWQIARST